MKKIIVIGLALFLVLAMGAFARPSNEQQIRLATGGTTGTYYAFGTAMAQTLQERTGIPFTVQSTGASVANIQLIDQGEVEMAIVQNDTIDYAWRGSDQFANDKRYQSFAAVATIYSEVSHIVVNANSGIATISDLRGKRVSVGDVGSGTELNTRHILEAYGIAFSDITVQNLGVGPSADALRNNQIDAFFFTAGPPTSAIVDLATSNNITFLAVDDAHVATLSQRYPFYTAFTFPLNTYRGLTTSIQTVGIKATLIVKADLSENTVYTLTKALFENRTAIAHAKSAEISPATAVQGIINVPWHAGAARYYREIGAMR
jgi:TRAP transporter TAXI family solute receptor